MKEADWIVDTVCQVGQGQAIVVYFVAHVIQVHGLEKRMVQSLLNDV
jgi:hypothetical protein